MCRARPGPSQTAILTVFAFLNQREGCGFCNLLMLALQHMYSNSTLSRTENFYDELTRKAWSPRYKEFEVTVRGFVRSIISSSMHESDPYLFQLTVQPYPPRDSHSDRVPMENFKMSEDMWFGYYSRTGRRQSDSSMTLLRLTASRMQECRVSSPSSTRSTGAFGE